MICISRESYQVRSCHHTRIACSIVLVSSEGRFDRFIDNYRTFWAGLCKFGQVIYSSFPRSSTASPTQSTPAPQPQCGHKPSRATTRHSLPDKTEKTNQLISFAFGAESSGWIAEDVAIGDRSICLCRGLGDGGITQLGGVRMSMRYVANISNYSNRWLAGSWRTLIVAGRSSQETP